MIDTLVLRIHGYEKYIHLVKFLEQINQTNYAKKILHPIHTQPNKISALYGDSDKLLSLSHRSTISVPSSHYTISFLLSKERDFLEFNLSIPKYLFSHNVMQFVDQHDTSNKHTYHKLIHFINKFFSDYLPVRPDYLDVEINRIDLCYNQFFLSKSDSMRYLDEQRNLNVSFARSDTNRFQQYGDTTVMYKTKNYSFKIYHKGTEFRKNDFPKLVKNNPKKIDLVELQGIADKILRYEITCRKGLFNYIFQQHLRNDENTLVNHNISRLSKMRNQSTNKMLTNFKKQPIAVTGTNESVEVFIHKTMHNKTFNFNLESNWNNTIIPPLQLLNCFDLPFNYELFDCLHSFFWERVKKYQLGVRLGLVDIHMKIKDFQQKQDLKNVINMKKNKTNYNTNLLLITTLSQYIDVSQLKAIIPKNTYYDYVRKLEALGIPRHSPDIAVHPPPLDYLQYFFYFAKFHNTFN